MIEVLATGEVKIIERLKSMLSAKKLKAAFPDKPGVYQWRPVSRRLIVEPNHKFWVREYGWAEGVVREEEWLDLDRLPVATKIVRYMK